MTERVVFVQAPRPPESDSVSALLATKQLEEVRSTMITPSDYVRKEVLQSKGRSYITNAPKLQINTFFCAAERTAFAKVFFSELAGTSHAGEHVAEGAVMAAIDCCIATSLIKIEQISFTAWLDVEFVAPIR